MIKFFLIFLCILAAGIRSKAPEYIFLSFAELFFIAWFTNILSVKNKKTAYILNSLGCFIILFQQGVLYYTGGFTSLLMLENIREFSALGSSIYKYTVLSAIFLTISFLPHKIKEEYFKKKKILIGIFAILFLGCAAQIVKYGKYPPVMSLYITVYKYSDSRISLYFDKTYSEEILKKFHKTTVVDKNAVLPLTPPSNKPNIILIFSEGFSAEVIDRFNNLNLNLTPNLNKLYDKSVVFTNYYNHTAATFRGIRGQLISGYQSHELHLTNSTALVSLVDILNENNYKTFFIGGEQDNAPLTEYLKNMRFAKVYSSADIQTKNKRLSDKETFALLGDILDECPKEPFFIGIYNIGTHFGADSPDGKYGDGKNDILNKFHNYDLQFGNFFRRFENSKLSDNTILIFTADHAAYPSVNYNYSFKTENIIFVNKIPLFIYWKNIPHKIIDAGRRNSLDLTPTVLHLLGIYEHDNFFLGRSLFSNEYNKFDEISAIGYDEIHYSHDVSKKIPEETLSLISEFYSISFN